MDIIFQAIKSVCPSISDETIEFFLSHLTPVEVKRKTILIRPHVNDRNVYFIEKGFSRSYNIIDGNEITSWFSKEGELIYSTNSMHGKTRGYENEHVQILEDSLLYYIPIADLEKLCQQDVEIANWLRILYQKAFIEMERRLIHRLYMSAEERYLDFCENNAPLLLRANLSYIASYLGMSHVTLCALRKSKLFL